MRKLTKNQENVLKCLTNDFQSLNDICNFYAKMKGTTGYGNNGYIWKSEVSKVILTLIRRELVEYGSRGFYKLKTIELNVTPNNFNGVDSVITNRGKVKFTELIPGDVIIGLVGNTEPLPTYHIVSFEVRSVEINSFTLCCNSNDVEVTYQQPDSYDEDVYKVTVKGFDFKMIQIIYSKYGISLLELNP